MKPNQLEKITRGGGVKMSKSTISPEVVKIIKKSVDEAVKKAAEAIVRANKEFDASQRNYFGKRIDNGLFILLWVG